MPVRDRLEELQQQRELLDKGSSKKPGRESKKKMDGGKTMQSFLADASKIEAQLEKMKTDVAEIKKLQQNMLSTPFADKKDIMKYESLGETVRNDATKIGGSLKQLEKKFDSTDYPDDSAFKRIRNQQLSTLAAELNISTNEFFKIQAEYMDKMKSRLRRQLSARGDQAATDDAKINALLDQDSYAVFTDNYISDVHDMEQTLRDLDDRKKDILALEKSVTDVNHLFKELNLLVSTQGETLNTIEDAVENTVVHVESGTKQLEKAREYQKRARRKKCCLIIIIIVVVLVIAGIIALIITQSS